MTKPLILAIDDAFDGIDAVRTSVQERGCDVTLCASARDGFDAAIKCRPILILLSADIPNGLATCNRFKSDTNFKDIPLVLMTAQEKDEVFAVHRDLPTHADHYLKKPLTSTEIERFVLSFLPEKSAEEDEDLVVDVLEDLGPAEAVGLDKSGAEKALEAARKDMSR